jgi:hypothetical protein
MKSVQCAIAVRLHQPVGIGEVAYEEAFQL